MGKEGGGNGVPEGVLGGGGGGRVKTTITGTRGGGERNNICPGVIDPFYKQTLLEEICRT